MSILKENYKLSNGVDIPKLGFGTWQIPDGSAVYKAVSWALEAGYRHIDTARIYGNESGVGRAVRDAGIPREDVFVTSKLPAEIKNYEEALKSFDETMDTLALDYLDLYLIHAPWPWDEIGKDCTQGNIEVWGALEHIYKSKRCRAIGVSNFEVSDLKAVIASSHIKPMVNQIKYYIGNTQEEVCNFCRKENICIVGYSPLARGAVLDNKKIKDMAAKYNKNAAQLCIRYLLQKDIIPIPKSTNKKHIIDNKEVDFKISSEDMKYLDGLVPLSNRGGWTVQGW